MRRSSIVNRWLGAGLAASLAVVTLGLAFTGRLALYIAPSSNWFAIPMAVLLLVGAVLSFVLPLGAEDEHGHEHGHGHGDGHGDRRERGRDHDHPAGGHDHPAPGGRRPRPRAALGTALTATGGVLATGVAAAALLLPPASLSAEIAQTRDAGAPPLFAGADLVSLATHGDTSKFGVGDWASVFATATDPDAFEGDAVTLTGFVTPADGSSAFALTRLVITHCVIDAQTASVRVSVTGASGGDHGQGHWVTVTGTVRSASDGRLEIAATEVTPIAEPKDPYEY